VHPRDRKRFDDQVDKVLAELPPQVRELLDRVPLHVEDHPSEDVMIDRGVEYLDDLCGLYTGIPLTQRSIEHSGMLPDVVTIYREGILTAAADRNGHICNRRLREEIRITILHEVGHHHGMTEEDLRELGYE
jgi:predicted Zn-dependent protease with MMP-like domain